MGNIHNKVIDMPTNDSELLEKVLSKFIGGTEMPLEYIKEDFIKKQGGAYNVSFDELCEVLKEMESEARTDTLIKLKSKFRHILYAYINDPDKSFKHIDEILKTIKVD